MLLNTINKNRWAVAAIFFYILVVSSILHWGIPGTRGPFLYHMDEWHQLMAVRSLAREGTSNTVGAANGPVFQFLLSLFWVAPGILSGYLNLDAITTPVTGLEVQERLFVLLRLNTLFFGTGTLIIVSYILRKLRGKQFFLLFLAAAPSWVLLSNYFKYDIALTFWLSASFAAYLHFGARPSVLRYILAAVPTGLAVATKISGLPIFIPYVLAYFLYTKDKQKNWSWLSYGLTSAFLIFCIFGIPDLLVLARGEYLEFLYDNIVRVPKQTAHFVVPGGPWFYLLFIQLPVQFGYGWLVLTVGTTLGVLFKKIKGLKIVWGTANEKLLFATILAFLTSLLPLKMYMVGNRAVVLLPFVVLVAAVCYKYLSIYLYETKMNLYLPIFCGLCLALQLFQTFTWLELRWHTDPRTEASAWLANNLKSGTTLGLEPIPLYQMVPDLVLADFYRGEYLPEYKKIYTYQVISPQTQKLPQYILITNASSSDFVKDTTKSELVKKITTDGYSEIKSFTPSWERFKYFGTPRDFYFSGLPAMPNDITIYSRN